MDRQTANTFSFAEFKKKYTIALFLLLKAGIC